MGSSRSFADSPLIATEPFSSTRHELVASSPTGITFGALFGRDMLDPDRHDHYREMIGDLITSYLTGGAADGSLPATGSAHPPAIP